MPLNRNEYYSTVYGETPDKCAYIQNGARYQSDGSLCEGSKEPVLEGELPYEDPMDGDIMASDDHPYKTIEGAQRRLIDDEDLDSGYRIVRYDVEEYALRKK